ncbi:hypothetical protein SDC9_140817 [bioreactor metagenome]|uniref:Uncharacterized protein n=1 Tax=bioreactor metagenome TaxID=1076179 RepID=A0A645DWC6_9ZZZZ|nr:hypothetical protein [Oscillibacter sp.]
MMLMELSITYRTSAQMLRQRIGELREERRGRTDPEEIRRLTRRIVELEPLLREARELAVVTARYYDREYHKNEKYCF